MQNLQPLAAHHHAPHISPSQTYNPIVANALPSKESAALDSTYPLASGVWHAASHENAPVSSSFRLSNQVALMETDAFRIIRAPFSQEGRSGQSAVLN